MAIVSAKIINAKNIEKALLNAFEEWAEKDVNEKHWEYQFKERRWDYGEVVTVRKSGEVVGPGPRNIYDLGTLYKSGVDSYKFSPSLNGAEASWHWNATNSSGREYASAVHYGTRFMDGRPFTDDISIPSSFFLKQPGKDLLSRVQTALDNISAR